MEKSSFVKVPNQLIVDTNLTTGEKLMLIILKGFDYLNKGYVYPSQRILMEAYDTKSRSIVSDKIKGLEAKGYIVKKRTKRNNVYYFVKDYLLVDVKERENINIYDEIDEKVDILNEELSMESSADNGENFTETGSEISTENSEICMENGADKCTKNKTYEEKIGAEKCTQEEAICTGNQVESFTKNSTSVCTENQALIRRNINKINYQNISNIIKKWNKLNINKVTKVDALLSNAIKKALSIYSEEDILQAIENYGLIMKSSFYYSYKWTLPKFLFNHKGIGKFVNGGEIMVRYHNTQYDDLMEEDEFDYEKYIK